MWSKRVLVILIFLTAFLQLMVHNPSQMIKTVCIEPVQTIIGRQIDYARHMELVYQPGLRHLGVPKEKILVEAVLPGSKHSFARIVKRLSANKGFAIIQCSAMDSWHTSKTGKIHLEKMRTVGYRVVIFDGGHHLPTLGLAPDILIVPQMHGYALHSYMRDGMQVKKIRDIAAELQLPCVIAVFPRWAVFKEQQALEKVTRTIISASGYRREPVIAASIDAEYHISKYNHRMFIYIDEQYYKDRDSLRGSIDRLGIDDVNKIYLAFDFKRINIQQAKVYAEYLEESLAIATEIVNDPVNFFNAFWSDKNVLSKQRYHY